MPKIVIILVIVIGLSIYGNFYQINNNLDLQEQISVINSKNTELSNQISSLTLKIDSLESKQPEPDKVIIPAPKSQKIDDSNTQSIKAVAVKPILLRSGFFQNVHYEGTVMNIEVAINEGTGLTLVNTAIPTGVDFQSSAKIAVDVAEKYLDTDLSLTDIIFSITSKDGDLQAVDGHSAGAAMAVLLISSLQDKKLNDDVIITGTINPDMSIGQVGGISEKADAAGKHEASIFLVPNKQGIVFVEECTESKTGNFVYRSCSSEAKPLSPITEEKYGMKTVEVNTIKDALLYFQ